MIGRREVFGYRQLADVLREEITSGRRPPGARLPSENTLIQQYGAARATVRKAIDVLREEGLVVVRHGRLTRVAEVPERTVVELELGSTLVVRRATPDERTTLGLSIGAHVAVVTSADGESHAYLADRHIFRSI